MEIPKELSACVKKALWRLSAGDMTCREMFLYLTDSHRKTYFPEEIADRCVSLLTDQGFLDDKRYLKLCVRHLDEKCYGPRRIRQELVKKHFPSRFVDAAMSRRIDYTARAVCRLKALPDAERKAKTPEGRKKLQDALVRYGFDYATARSALAAFSDSEED